MGNSNKKTIQMKKSLFILGAITMLISCSKGPETENLAKGRVEDAKKYATETTGKLIDFASALGGLSVDPNFKFKSVKDSIVDNTAWVTFINAKGENDEIKLVEIDGEWLVHVESKK